MKFRYSLLFSSTIILIFSFAYAINVKDITFSGRNYGKVKFNHNFHINQKGTRNNCKTCHNAIFNIKKKTSYTMADMGKGKSCGACHNGKRAFKIEECARCHPTRDVDFKVKDTGDVKFGHDLHTGMYKCGDCHDKLYLPSAKNKRISMAEMEAAKSCGACHDGKSAFTVKENCDRCHKM